MEFALFNGERITASPSALARCPQCKDPVIPKCGQIVVHHWAHMSGTDCDPWSEPETLWHRHWKSFGHQTEVTIVGHRADVITSSGLIVELQHSGISVEEIQQRELSYGQNLRWLFDGTDIPVRAPNGDFLSSETCYEDEREEEEYYHPIHGWCQKPPIRVIDGRYGLTKQWKSGELWGTYKARLCLRNKGTSKEGWEVVTFRWYHPRKHYGLTSRGTYIDLPGKFVLKLGKLHLEDGAPYGGWGYLVPRVTVEGWLQ